MNYENWNSTEQQQLVCLCFHFMAHTHTNKQTQPACNSAEITTSLTRLAEKFGSDQPGNRLIIA